MSRILLLFVLALFLVDRTWAVNRRPGRNGNHQEDPYKILGVGRTATDDEIQKAYRKKAKETHPDKNSSPSANDEFRRVADAFEILGNPAARRKYDNAFRQEQRHRSAAREYQRRQEQTRKRQKEKERQEKRRIHWETVAKAKSTHSRMMRLSTLEQFETMMLNSKKEYVQNFLCIFVGNKKAEKIAEEEYYFPFPFAGSSRDDLSFVNVIQTAKVRYNKPTRLTSVFQVPSRSNAPYVIFARKGSVFGQYEAFRPRQGTDVHAELVRWVEARLVVEVVVQNHHSSTVNVFVVREEKLVFAHSVLSNHQLPFSLKVGDRVVVFDSLADSFPGGVRNNEQLKHAKNIFLLDVQITNDATYTVQTKRCLDISWQCLPWTHSGRSKNVCDTHPEFMHNVCPLSCNVCSEHWSSDFVYFVRHYPIKKLPNFLQGIVEAGRFFFDDMRNIVNIRKNAAMAFFVAGILGAINIFQLDTFLRSNNRPKQHAGSHLFSLVAVLDFSLLFLVFVTNSCSYWLLSAPKHAIPNYLKAFHSDFGRVVHDIESSMGLFAFGLIIFLYLKSLFQAATSKNFNESKIWEFVAIFLTLVCGMFGIVSFMTALNTGRVIRWKHLWKFRKNAAFVVIGTGMLNGAAIFPLKRMATSIQKKSHCICLFVNLVLLVLFCGFALFDRHFTPDLKHVMKLRKNAVAALALFGFIIGSVGAKLAKILPHQPPKKLKTE